MMTHDVETAVGRDYSPKPAPACRAAGKLERAGRRRPDQGQDQLLPNPFSPGSYGPAVAKLPDGKAPEKVRFKYILEGQDPDWKEVINDRQVQYSNLRPRKYRFRVIACNNSGVWNETGDRLEFFIEPRYYQTAWFGGACVAAFLTMLWGLHRLRLHQLAREFNARIGERTRIARELHDTLLQSFQGLMFSFQAARNLLPGRAEEAICTLDGAIREGDEAIADGRDAIQGLRANPVLESILEYQLTVAGKELARSSSSVGEPPKF